MKNKGINIVALIICLFFLLMAGIINRTIQSGFNSISSSIDNLNESITELSVNISSVNNSVSNTADSIKSLPLDDIKIDIL
jgi:methyl-accepting chemotaxis protein